MSRPETIFLNTVDKQGIKQMKQVILEYLSWFLKYAKHEKK